MKVDINKQYRTKAGREVRVFTTGAPEPYPVVGIWKDSWDNWVACNWTISGKVLKDETSLADLEEIKSTRLVYVNLYPVGWIGLCNAVYHNTLEAAKQQVSEGAIAVAVPVYIEEEE